MSPGEPSEGAGEIAEPGETDVFALDAGAGEQIFLDVQPIEGECPPRGMRWKLEHAERGTEVFDEPLFDCAEPFDEDGFTLEEGTYVLTVYGTDGVTGTYRFLPAPLVVEEFTLALGDVVEPGEPGEGAGEIAEPGQLDVFTLDAAGGRADLPRRPGDRRGVPGDRHGLEAGARGERRRDLRRAISTARSRSARRDSRSRRARMRWSCTAPAGLPARIASSSSVCSPDSHSLRAARCPS